MTQATNVDLDASATASISALVASLSAAVGIGVGGAGVGASIWISIARNFIGYDPSNPAYMCTAPACYDSTAATSTITTGTRVHVVSGDRAGENYEYVGGTTLTNAILTTQNYDNASLWKHVVRRGPGAGLHQGLVDPGERRLDRGRPFLASIAALVVAASVAVGAGAVAGVGFSGAGVFAENRIATDVKAFIDGDCVTGASTGGINVGSVALHADDTSAIGAFAGAASVAFALGTAAGVSISIGVALAQNEIESDIAAYIANASTTSRHDDLGRHRGPRADEAASITVIAAAASVAVGLGPGAGNRREWRRR